MARNARGIPANGGGIGCVPSYKVSQSAGAFPAVFAFPQTKYMRYSQPVVAVVLAVAALNTAVPPAPAQEDLGEEGFGFFYDSLAPYGDWINIGGHGPCWRPEVEEGWSPYTDGYWAYTDVGWTWVSHEPFGSIVYHYGRWLITNRGWCWVPGADWSPAWVSWRTGEDYIGWAPLPPEVPWHPQRGISTWVDVHTEIGPGYYRFCDVRDFAAPVLTDVLLRPSRNAVIMVRTQNVTNITLRNSTVYCGGPRYGWVSENCSGGVPLLRVAREENVRHYRSLQGSGGGVQNFVFNNILVLPAPKRVEFAAAARSFPASPSGASVSKGWYSDPSGNERLKSHISREWEQRRASEQTSATSKEPGGPALRLTTPTAAEKKAALSGIASTPAPAPWAGGGRPGNVSRGGSAPGGENPSGVPKALPVRPETSSFRPKPVGGGTAPVVEAGPDRGAFGQPVRNGSSSGNGASGGLFGGQQQVRPEQNPTGLQRPTVGGPPERTGSPVGVQGSFGRTGQPNLPNNQTSRGSQPPQEAEVIPRAQAKTGVGKNPGIGEVPGGGVVPVRPTGGSSSGFSQPQVSRTGSNFPPQAVGGAPRGGGATEAPVGFFGRSGGGSVPVQAAPLPRSGQPAAVVDQPARFQRTGPGASSQPAQSSPASSAGISGGGRAQTSPSVSSVAPAPPAGAVQKKKPGDPGYVPGNP
jgi:hypothetical protein